MHAVSNLTSGTLPADQSENSTLIWDAENRLVAVTKSDNSIIRFSYDYQSRRISKGVDGSTTTRYIYDGWNMIADYTEDTVARTYTWGQDLSGSMQGAGGVGGLLQVTDHGSQSTDHSYPTYDGNGNVSEYLDNTGTAVAHYEYDSFGNITVSNGARVNDFEHKFSTKLQDAETGLYYYGYRYYDPVTGRWPNRDPIAESGGFNLYGFVGNDSLNSWDYLGQFQFEEEFWRDAFPDWIERLFDDGELPPELEPSPVSLSLPKLNLKFKKGFSVSGCALAGPGVVVCLKGDVSVKVGKCCKEDGSKGDMFEASGSITAGFGVGTGGWSVSYDVAAVETDFGLSKCPTENNPTVKGAIEISASAAAGPFQGGASCSYTFPGGGWSCGAGLSAGNGAGVNATVGGGINISGKYIQ